MNKPVKFMSGILLFIIIIAAVLNDKENLFNFFAQAGPVALALNVVMLAIGFLTAKMANLHVSQSITISIESGIQNGTLGIAIAATLLRNPTMTISPAIYSLIMFMTAGIIIAWMNMKYKDSKVASS
jgi:bile acid:Na+ symporter, BASS family